MIAAIRRRLNAKWLVLPVAVIYVVLARAALERGNSLLIGFVLVLLSMAPFLWRFERSDRQARELVLIAVMAAVASVSRIPFAAMLPGFTPVTFIVIVSGVVFGAEAGWMVGAVAGLVSNFFLGQGPWTPWQMFAWGMAGFTAGLFAHRSPVRRGRWPLVLFGAGWGFLYGWILNVTLALDIGVREQSWQAVMAIYALGLPFEVVHAAANVFFLAVFGPSWIRLLERYRKKYGVLHRTESPVAGANPKEESPMAKEPLLNESELEDGLKSLSGWTVEEGKLVRKYMFPSFADAIAFVNKVAGIAERMNHHPFISIDFRKVTLRLTTWHSGGITGLDLESAKAYDE